MTHLVYRKAETRTCVKDARSPCVVGLIRPTIIGWLSEAGPRDDWFAPSQVLLLFALPSRPHHNVVLSQRSPVLDLALSRSRGCLREPSSWPAVQRARADNDALIACSPCILDQRLPDRHSRARSARPADTGSEATKQA